jgi:hypothetical protein
MLATGIIIPVEKYCSIKIPNSFSKGTIFYEVSNRGVTVIFENIFIDLIISLGLTKDYQISKQHFLHKCS